MKCRFFIGAMLFISFSAQCQDNIVLKNGEEIEAKIIEFFEDEVHFKNFLNLSGPKVVIKSENIFMIKLENGEKILFSDKIDNSNSAERKLFDDNMLLDPDSFSADETATIHVMRKRAYFNSHLRANLKLDFLGTSRNSYRVLSTKEFNLGQKQKMTFKVNKAGYFRLSCSCNQEKFNVKLGNTYYVYVGPMGYRDLNKEWKLTILNNTEGLDVYRKMKSEKDRSVFYDLKKEE